MYILLQCVLHIIFKSERYNSSMRYVKISIWLLLPWTVSCTTLHGLSIILTLRGFLSIKKNFKLYAPVHAMFCSAWKLLYENKGRLLKEAFLFESDSWECFWIGKWFFFSVRFGLVWLFFVFFFLFYSFFV